ncbi:MAG: TraB/GumN family protein [Gammaproteobacteria bacterium]
MSALSRTWPRIYVLLFSLLSSLQVWPAAASEFKHGILWEISKPGIHHSYVFGTIHSDDPRVTRLPQAVELAFDYSHSFTGELDMSDQSMRRTEQAMLLPAGSSLEKLIGPERYRKCVALMADYGVPRSVVSRMRPWAVALQLNMPKPQNVTGSGHRQL